ncbi:MAG: TetR/AcrR family transcriptional regulator [Candidatus Dormibacteraeota bacterium]|nr:TetR/AcrR family transcriptional regulator [Candidatus Dormibacteraeota bacterium]MBV9525277.1 TetR/AcrR family transcriptional regulator [Candidatus Dormibacteraeota bacterium]
MEAGNVATVVRRGDTGTAERILDVAERLVQTKGFNAFSYADVAGELRLSKPSLHYHFASKADLGAALIDRYAARFADALRGIDSTATTSSSKLRDYAHLYADVLDQQRMCLCGMLAADFDTLPAPMRRSVVRFFDDSEAWLTGVLDAGRSDGTLHFAGSAREQAQLVISALEGAMLVARSYHDAARFRAAAEHLIAALAATPATRRSRR